MCMFFGHAQGIGFLYTYRKTPCVHGVHTRGFLAINKKEHKKGSNQGHSQGIGETPTMLQHGRGSVAGYEFCVNTCG